MNVFLPAKKTNKNDQSQESQRIHKEFILEVGFEQLNLEKDESWLTHGLYFKQRNRIIMEKLYYNTLPETKGRNATNYLPIDALVQRSSKEIKQSSERKL